MPRMITSKNMGSVSELTLVADIRPELVEIRQTMTHATRLRILLRTLYGIRRAGVEESRTGRIAGPLERLEFLHFVRFALLDNDTKFLLGVTFDGAWEPYIRAIAEQAGPLLDVIFCHTVDYNAHASDRGYGEFSDWVRRHQVEADFFFADSPGTAARDVQWLKDFERRTIADPTLGYEGPGFEEPASPNIGRDDVIRGIRALHQLHGLDAYFPAEQEKTFLRRTSRMILAPVLLPIAGQLKHWEDYGRGQHLPHVTALDWVRTVRAPSIPAPAPKDLVPDAPDQVQGNILEAYPNRTHGALLMLRIADKQKAQGFLARVELTSSKDQDPEIARNLGLTFEGLRKLGVREEELAKLPQEFREGMAARAGWLGDLGPNHPSQWRLPRVNWPIGGATDSLRLRLDSVDVVIQLQARGEATAGDHRFDAAHPLFPLIRDEFGDPSNTGLQLMAVEVQRAAHTDKTRNVPFALEHFGFLDGISQPTIRTDAPERDQVALGELVLGYPDDRDGVAARPSLDFLHNGSFQVVRKLRQDVAGFRRILDENPEIADLARSMMGRPLASADELMDLSAAEGDVAGALDFDFEDKGWEKTPVDAHTRRSNPRNGPPRRDDRVRNPTQRAVPRIARRGFPYGPDESEEGDDQGLLFCAYNASLADQFEVVQRWLTRGSPSGAPGLRSDPFLAPPEPGKHKTFTILDDRGRPERTIDLGPTPLVTLEWGLYLFTPSISALRELATVDLETREIEDWASEADVREGEGVIGRMEQLLEIEKVRDPARAHFLMAARWKVLVEDLSARETMRKVWGAIRARGGALDTPYGVLVGSREQIAQIFRDRADYSVSGYWDRMRDSLGEHYLGMDPDPARMAPHANAPARIMQDRFVAAVDSGRYARESEIANAWIAGISREEAFDHAVEVATGVLNEFVYALAPDVSVGPEGPDETVVDVRRLVDETVARMCTRWFDLPDADQVYMTRGGPLPAPAHNNDAFKSTARYIFSPNPTDFVRADGREKGSELLEKATEFVRMAARRSAEGEQGRPQTGAGADAPDPPARETLLAHLFDRREELVGDGIPEHAFERFCAGILLGTIHGFVGPVGGSATSLLNEWIKNRELWRQQQALLEAVPDPMGAIDWEVASRVMLADVKEGMRIQPFPYVLHRTPVRDVRLRQRPRRPGERAGPPAVEEGDTRPENAPLEFDLEIEAGARVVLGMVSGAHDSTREIEPIDMPVHEMLFGGAFRPNGDGQEADGAGFDPAPTGVHACPGYEIGMGTILGIVAALARAGNLRRIAPLKLELDPFPARRIRLTRASGEAPAADR